MASYAAYDTSYHNRKAAAARETAIENAQTCPECLREVTPDNFDKHNAVYHPDAPVMFVRPGGFDFNALDVATRVVVVQEDKEFDQNIEDAGTKFIRACHNIRRIHEALRYKRPGFAEYYATKRGLRKRTAYKMILVSEMCAENAQILAAKEALYLLAKGTTPREAQLEALDRAQSGEYISHPIAQEIVERHGVTAPETIARIEVGIERKSEWVNEARLSGWIQPGDKDDAIHIADTPQNVDAAIAKRAEHHRQMAINEKLATPPPPVASESEPTDTRPVYTFEIPSNTAPFTLVVTATNLSQTEVAILQRRLQLKCAQFESERKDGKLNADELNKDPNQPKKSKKAKAS